MGRRLCAAALFLAVVAMVGGCAPAAGVDGDLTDDWTALPTAAQPVPKAADCHGMTFSSPQFLTTYSPVPCTGAHWLETAHVGTFTGADAERTNPPPEGSPGRRAAFAECAAKAAELLGGDHRTGLVWLGVGVPTDRAWVGGARWFRCDLWQITFKFVGGPTDPVARNESLRGTLAPDRPLRFGCFTITEPNANDIHTVPIACDQPHNGEFAGIHVAKDVPWPTDDKDAWEVLGRGCYGVIAKYAGLPDDSRLQYRVGLAYHGYSEWEWQQGNRGALCLLWLDKNVTKVMKGAGPAAFPIR